MAKTLRLAEVAVGAWWTARSHAEYFAALDDAAMNLALVLCPGLAMSASWTPSFWHGGRDVLHRCPQLVGV